ncbi:hypothetical protein ES708_10202 [subsurface metagenome]
MKGGVTKRIEDTVKALDGGQLKKALYLTESNEKLSQQHQFIEEAARTCLANKDNKETCSTAIKEARAKVQDTVTLPIDDTSIEGLGEYLTKPELSPQPVEQAPPIQEAQEPEQKKTDDELYEECEECHVAVAASRFADICAENSEEAGGICKQISKKLEDETTEPADWIKAMVETAEGAEGKAKEEMVATVTELTDYLQRRNSPLLKELDKGDKENGTLS